MRSWLSVCTATVRRTASCLRGFFAGFLSACGMNSVSTVRFRLRCCHCRRTRLPVANVPARRGTTSAAAAATAAAGADDAADGVGDAAAAATRLCATESCADCRRRALTFCCRPAVCFCRRVFRKLGPGLTSVQPSPVTMSELPRPTDLMIFTSFSTPAYIKHRTDVHMCSFSATHFLISSSSCSSILLYALALPCATCSSS